MSDNELIAEFLGLERSKEVWDKDEYAYTMKFWDCWNKWVIPSHMHFHDRWDWLMPVVEKIGGMRKEREEFADTHFGTMDANTIFTPLPVVYKVVVEFIKWYNSQTVTP